MRKELLDLLLCPQCETSFQVVPYKSDGECIKEGLLRCNYCGKEYPIIDTIPRMLPNSQQSKSPTDLLKRETQESFGYQWQSFRQMSCDFRDNFLNYIYPVKPEFFKGKFGLDAGCGFGRHIYNAAKFGAKMVGIDFSQAIESSYLNTRQLDNVYLAQADIYNLPFPKDKFDFVYSIGVLHHLPNPELGFQSLLRLVKPKGAIFIWVYSNQRKWTIKILELVRKITTQLPFPLLKALCFFIALIDYYFLVFPFCLMRRNKYLGERLEKFLFPRIRLYWQYPFQVNFADWFDRLSAPIRFYYDGNEIKGWFEKAGLRNITVSSTGYYGWRAYGEKD
ncbi:MAG: methyltransferase domain-containing protein [Candidatus Omnitrophica bacterium]|nr:methyltransferase domain-containing protein [Candidatus Omnitrophota bacterium]